MGFDVAVIEEACRPLDEANVPVVRAELRAAGVEILTADEAVRRATDPRGRERTLREVLSGARQTKAAQGLHAGMTLGAHASMKSLLS